MQPIYTSTSDVLGRKLPLYVAFFFFGLGSIVFAVAKSMSIVILGRVLMGLGGGGIDVLNEVIVADITTMKERASYLGLLSIPMAAGCILGPILGALFSEYVDWRWIGWINLPLIGIALPLAIFFLRLKPLDHSFGTRLKRLDWIGMLLFAIGSTLFTVPLSWADSQYPWSSFRTILPLVVGVIVLVIFGVYERRPQEPVFPYRIFASRTAAVTLLGSFIHGMTLYSLLFYLPLFFQSVYLQTPLESAVLILPFCAVVMAFTGIAAYAVDYIRKYRWEIWLGWIFLTVGAGLFSLWDRHTSVAARASYQVICGIGVGTLFTVPPIPMQASAPNVEDQGLAVGILVSFRLFGALIGLAISATTFASVFQGSIAPVSSLLPESLAALRDGSQAVAFIPTLRQVQGSVSPEILDAVLEAYQNSMQSIWYILAAFGALGFVASLLTKELSLEGEDVGRQGFDHEKDSKETSNV